MDQSNKKVFGLNAIQFVKLCIYLAAGLSLIMSNYLYFTGEVQAGIYIGIWVPSILSAGVLMLAKV